MKSLNILNNALFVQIKFINQLSHQINFSQLTNKYKCSQQVNINV